MRRYTNRIRVKLGMHELTEWEEPSSMESLFVTVIYGVFLLLLMYFTQ